MPNPEYTVGVVDSSFKNFLATTIKAIGTLGRLIAREDLAAVSKETWRIVSKSEMPQQRIGKPRLLLVTEGQWFRKDGELVDVVKLFEAERKFHVGSLDC